MSRGLNFGGGETEEHFAVELCTYGAPGGDGETGGMGSLRSTSKAMRLTPLWRRASLPRDESRHIERSRGKPGVTGVPDRSHSISVCVRTKFVAYVHSVVVVPNTSTTPYVL
ncbi:hypothetical protein Trydic_g12447 [Trypoxylus dichotomus]